MTKTLSATRREEIEQVLHKLAEKRGKHSELWLYPKYEALKEAADALDQLFTKWLEEVMQSMYRLEPHGNGWWLFFKDEYNPLGWFPNKEEALVYRDEDIQKYLDSLATKEKQS